jgi:hypothetical protein
MRIVRSLFTLLMLASFGFAADKATIPAKVIGERMAPRQSTGTAIGNVILNVPIPSAPNPTSRNPVPPSSDPSARRIISVEIGDFIYDWEQVGGQRFQVIPDDTISCYEEKGTWIVQRNNRKYEFIAVEIRRK